MTRGTWRYCEDGVLRDTLGICARINARTDWCAGSAGPLPAHKVVGRDVPWPDGWTAI
ncbi:hypothetical protein [Methylobacterium nodulans]|uniref:Uncharacterized protein n=1 Tax=Methylobacterium nodulans (strain LMG 21967 / CNCM I-2342 / ORS 2060) TaxID=460265 RepID=B8IXW4_METNO|nr:hypothetical protein [Methylobacterium nodulans]ACL63254.1 hypothetical protein Mnod_8794 [Methylobacterium nodulans ORS 2060]